MMDRSYCGVSGLARTGCHSPHGTDLEDANEAEELNDSPRVADYRKHPFRG